MKRAAMLAPADSGASTLKPQIKTAESGAAPAVKEPEKTENLDVTCPVCHSELRIGEAVRARAKPGSAPPPAELLRKQTDETSPTPAPAPVQDGTAGEPHLTVEEREKQIAAARQAHPVSLNTPMKPRLEYVLTDKTPPLVKEGKDAEARRSAAKEKTVTE